MGYTHTHTYSNGRSLHVRATFASAAVSLWFARARACVCVLLLCRLRESMGVGADSTQKAFRAEDVTQLMQRETWSIPRNVYNFHAPQNTNHVIVHTRTHSHLHIGARAHTRTFAQPMALHRLLWTPLAVAHPHSPWQVLRRCLRDGLWCARRATTTCRVARCT